MARKETPPEMVNKLHGMFKQAVETPATVARLKGVGMDATTTKTPAEFTAIIQKTLDNLTASIEKSGLKFN